MTMAPMVSVLQGQTPKGQLELDEIEVEDHPKGREAIGRSPLVGREMDEDPPGES